MCCVDTTCAIYQCSTVTSCVPSTTPPIAFNGAALDMELLVMLRILGKVLAAGVRAWNGRPGPFGLRTMCVNSADRESVAFLVTTVCFRGELNDGMQRNLDVWQICLWQIVEVRIEATENGLGTRVELWVTTGPKLGIVPDGQ